MKVTGAVIRERGVVFGVLLVRSQVLQNFAQRSEVMRSAASLPMFAGLPLVLAGKQTNRAMKYFGRKDLAAFLASVDASQIPWREYVVG